MARDPVCGMDVEENKAAGSHQHGGHAYFFCSAHCLEAFTAEPETYVGKPPRSETQTPGAKPVQERGRYTCPMHPEIDQAGPGTCPKCGMALEPKGPPIAASKTDYTCPMHPEVVQDHPGTCPKCGMALEARTADAGEDTAELDDMTRRFWISAALAIPVFFSAMAAEFWPEVVAGFVSARTRQWVEMTLSTPVVWWGGWIFFVRGWQSIVTRNLNMFTLIGLGVAVAWSYSAVAVLVPGLFPTAVFNAMGVVPVYFEAAAVITALVLLGQVLELRARSRTNAAIKLLLGLAPKTARIVAPMGPNKTFPSIRWPWGIFSGSAPGRRCRSTAR